MNVAVLALTVVALLAVAFAWVVSSARRTNAVIRWIEQRRWPRVTADPREVIAQCVHAAGMREDEDPLGCGLACHEGAGLILDGLTAAGLVVVPAAGRRANEQGRSVGASDCRPKGSGGVPPAETLVEWGVRRVFADGTACCVDVEDDRSTAAVAALAGGEVVRRTVGPWEPASGRDGNDTGNG